ncbi:unnamed protein product [Lepidochelys kempii]
MFSVRDRAQALPDRCSGALLHAELEYSNLKCRLLFIMPAGVSWPRYLKMLSASTLAMFAGAEVVHRYYRPDLTIPEMPPKPGELKTELLGLKQRSSEVHTSQQ